MCVSKDVPSKYSQVGSDTMSIHSHIDCCRVVAVTLKAPGKRKAAWSFACTLKIQFITKQVRHLSRSLLTWRVRACCLVWLKQFNQRALGSVRLSFEHQGKEGLVVRIYLFLMGTVCGQVVPPRFLFGSFSVLSKCVLKARWVPSGFPLGSLWVPSVEFLPWLKVRVRASPPRKSECEAPRPHLCLVLRSGAHK